MNQSISNLSSSVPLRDPDRAPPAAGRDAPERSASPQPDDGISFDDVLNALNPLQHIPVVSDVYRAVSGNEIGLGPRLIGATILGGPIGLIIAGISAMFEEASGGSVVQHAMALFDDGDNGIAPAKAIAGGPDHSAGKAGATAPTVAAALDASALATTPGQYRPLVEDGDWAAAPATPPASPFAIAAKPGAAPAPVLAGLQGGTESRRAARALLESQRAQANLLLANLKSRETAKAQPDEDDERRRHANLPPSDAMSGWYADAMQRALDKYQSAHAAHPVTSRP